MAAFEPAYQIVRQHEGGYANNPADAGGETYAGIARNYWPNEPIWTIVDYYKRVRGGLNTNEIIPDGGKVEQFYRDRWAASRAGEINSQAVANIYFDFYILHSQAVRAMQEVLNAMGFPVAIDNKIGPQTLNAINAADSNKLHDAYKAKRIAIHNDRVQQNPSQLVFLKGWLQRAASFPTLTGMGSVFALFIMALLATGWWYYKKQKSNNSK
jgi:lysozyme family protein